MLLVPCRTSLFRQAAQETAGIVAVDAVHDQLSQGTAQTRQRFGDVAPVNDSSLPIRRRSRAGFYSRHTAHYPSAHQPPGQIETARDLAGQGEIRQFFSVDRTSNRAHVRLIFSLSLG